MTYADRDTVCQKGKFRLEEWEDVNYCEHCFYNGDEPLEDEEVVLLLGKLTTENEQLKTQLQNTSDQRDEFHRGARENANRVGKLEKENEQLRHDATILIQSNQDYRKENEQLKQFKEDVFNKIDMHLRMLPTARDNEFDEDDGDPSLYVGAIYMLETLKKELEE